MKHALFLKWWLFNILLSIGWIIAYNSGIVGKIWETDFTYICATIFIIFIFCTIIFGFKIHKVCNNQFNIKEIQDWLHYSWFLANTCSGLGLLGTVISMLYLMQDIGHIDLNNVKLDNFSTSMSHALTTTMCGITARILIESQSIVLERFINND